MERRKADAKDQYQKLKQECIATVELLNKLIHTCSSHLDSLDRLDSKEHKLKSKYFLTVTHFQHLSHQKILELNIDLEDYLLENTVFDFEHFKETAISPSSGLKDFYRHSASSPTSINDQFNLKKLPDDSLIFTKDIVPNNELHLNDVEGNFETVAETKEPDIETDKIDTNLDPLATSSILNESTSTTNDIFFEFEDNDKLVSDTVTAHVDVKNPVVEENEFIILDGLPIENIEPAVSYISERLKAHTFISLEERYEQSLPKPQMPDITLKPSDIKRFVVDDDLNNIEETTVEDNIQQPYVIEKSKVVKQVQWVNNVVTPNMDLGKNAVFEIDDRHSPVIGDICMIGYMESPSNFYVQVCDENSILLDVMSSQLAEINSGTTLLCSTKQDVINQVGKFCTLAIDGIWYRAEVTDWLQNSNSDQVYIQLIDYGCQYSVTYKNLRPLPPFCKSPKLSQKCYLAYLYPAGSTSEHKLEKWPAACKDAFINYCGDIDTNDFRITYIRPSPQEKNTYEVDLVRTSEESDDKSIGDILLEAGLAVQIIDDLTGLVKHDGMLNQILTAHGIGGIKSDMTREEVLDLYFGEIDEEPATINEAVMKYNPRDEAETCRNLRPDGTCYKGSSCKWRHQVLTSGYTNDKDAVYSKAFSDLSLPEASQAISITISHIVDIQCFYAQIRNEVNGITQSINDLINTMNEPQICKKYQRFELVPGLGEIVIAKHWNNYWYRGQVRDIDTANCKTARTEVYFVDFGDILEVAVSDLRIIMPEFLELPFQAVECRLYNIKHKQGNDHEREKIYFESQFLGVTLKAFVVAVPGHLQVLLQNNNGEDIGLQLIEQGFGELNTEHNFPAGSELILID